MGAQSSAYHVQRDSFTSYCGRKIGTPGGRIYPGVRVQWKAWYLGHRFPDAIERVTCWTCMRLAGIEGKIGSEYAREVRP